MYYSVDNVMKIKTCPYEPRFLRDKGGTKISQKANECALAYLVLNSRRFQP